MSDIQIHKKGESPDVTLTSYALQHIVSQLQKNAGCKGFRLSVKTTGCSGLSYSFDYVEEPDEDDIAQQLSDKYWIYIDRKSYPYLKGLSIDYISQGLNKKLVFQNPNQTGQCGCGESFTVDSTE